MYIYTVDIQGLKVTEIRNTIYFYSASPESIKIFIKPSLDSDLKQKFEFKGNYIGKKCIFRIDQKGRFKFLGEAKPPKDPIKRVFWDHGFTGARRVDSYSDINNSLRASFYIRDDNNDIRHFSDLSGVDNTKIVLSLEPDTKTWWASEDLTLEEAKSIMEKYTIMKV